MTKQPTFDSVLELLNKVAENQTKTDAKLDRLAQLYGNVADNQGAAAEEFFFNSLGKNPVIGGIRYDRVMHNVSGHRHGKQAEFDLVLVNGNSVALIEVKFKAHPKVIDQLEQQISAYRDLFPEHKDYAIYAGVAGFSVPSDVVQAAHEKGLFVLKTKGDVMLSDDQHMRAF
jgi:hypothetical protein